MAKLKYLVIHCTATPEGREVSTTEIRRWHTGAPPAGRGWKQVGYTDLFHLNGSVERLVANNEDEEVDPWEITNGAKGYNSVSRHVVYAGGVENRRNPKTGLYDIPKDTRTEAQRKSMAEYVKAFHAAHPKVKIIGHNEVATKACPSFDVQAWLKEIGIKEVKAE